MVSLFSIVEKTIKLSNSELDRLKHVMGWTIDFCFQWNSYAIMANEIGYPISIDCRVVLFCSGECNSEIA